MKPVATLCLGLALLQAQCTSVRSYSPITEFVLRNGTAVYDADGKISSTISQKSYLLPTDRISIVTSSFAIDGRNYTTTYLNFDGQCCVTDFNSNGRFDFGDKVEIRENGVWKPMGNIAQQKDFFRCAYERVQRDL